MPMGGDFAAKRLDFSSGYAAKSFDMWSQLCMIMWRNFTAVSLLRHLLNKVIVCYPNCLAGMLFQANEMDSNEQWTGMHTRYIRKTINDARKRVPVPAASTNLRGSCSDWINDIVIVKTGEFSTNEICLAYSYMYSHLDKCLITVFIWCFNFPI